MVSRTFWSFSTVVQLTPTRTMDLAPPKCSPSWGLSRAVLVLPVAKSASPISTVNHVRIALTRPYANPDSLGDGTADYLVSYDGGAVRFYRNNGNLERDPAKPSWENLGVIAAGVQQQGIVIFGDLDGLCSQFAWLSCSLTRTHI